MLELKNVDVTADNIFVDPDLPNKARQTDSGLYLPDRATTDGKKVHPIPKSGRVMAVGPDVPSEIEIGMRIIFNVEKVVGVRLNDKEGFLIVKPDQVVAWLDGDEHVS